MKEPRISAIAAVGKNRELGRDNDLVWRLDADFNRMKEIIKGHTLIMGRSTYESIGRELPSPSIVITSKTNYQSPYEGPKHTSVVTNLEAALAKAKEIESQNDNEEKEVFIFGGQQVYTDALPHTQRLYMTEIDGEAEADRFFPDYSEFTKVIEESTGAENGINFRFVTLERGQ